MLELRGNWEQGFSSTAGGEHLCSPLSHHLRMYVGRMNYLIYIYMVIDNISYISTQLSVGTTARASQGHFELCPSISAVPALPHLDFFSGSHIVLHTGLSR